MEGHAVVAVDPREPLVDVVADLLLPVAEHRLPARGEVGSATLQVPVPEPVVGAVDGQRVALLALPEGRLAVHPLDRVPDRAQEQLVVHLALHEVVLCSLTDRRERYLLVIQVCEDHDWDVGCDLAGPLEGGQPAAVRQREVQQHHVHRSGPHALETLLEPRHVLDAERLPLRLGEHQPDELRLLQVVLDQEHRQRSCLAGHVLSSSVPELRPRVPAPGSSAA